MLGEMGNIEFPLIDGFDDNNAWETTGEGGMFVYAIVRESKSAVKPGPVIDAPIYIHQESVCTSHSQYQHIGNGGLWIRDEDSDELLSEQLFAAVLLDCHSLAFYDKTWGEYFHADKSDLTAQGEQIVQALSLIGEVELVTFLDT